jgi:23S rRNA (adenine2503-C2)-methyltransferase
MDASGTPGPRQPGSSERERPLLGLTAAEFTARATAAVGYSARFHRPLYRELMATGRYDPRSHELWRPVSGTAIGRLRDALPDPLLPTLAAEQRAEDPGLGATTKLTWRLADGALVESVLIPMRAGRHHTICLSSQVGCRMGCAFCHTASMGLVRQLAADEMIAQVLATALHTRVSPRNVVFMGMGEPLDNAEEVAQAVRVLGDRGGLALANRHLTISTVGRIAGLARWSGLGLSGVNLAVSLGSADQAVREQLMPIAKANPLPDLKRALQQLPLGPGRRLLISCIIIPGLTDTVAALEQLEGWLAGLPALVNLLPYNPIPGRPWRAPSGDEVAAVRDWLDRACIPVRLRTTKGRAVMAACGQLATATASAARR